MQYGVRFGVRHGTAKKIRTVGWWALAAAALIMTAVLLPEAAAAQSWWPFGGGDEERPPVPQEPVYRPQAAPPPAPGVAPPPEPSGDPAGQPAPAPQARTNWAVKNPICYQLEQRLLQDSQKNNQSQDALPRIESELRIVDNAYNAGQAQLDRNCYESLFFIKTFRNTPQCKDLARQVEASQRKLGDLEARRQELMNSGRRSYHDDIVRELARSGCGANYVEMARQIDRNGESGMWQDEESGAGNTWSPLAANGAQTYRTICVRLCDGYYFPVSFSTLPSHFTQDSDICSSKCAAPAELFYYPNPGGSVDQALALKTQEAYAKLKVAFRYRKEFVNGCSCKAAEYKPEADPNAPKKADAAKTSSFAQRRADAQGPADLTTGSTAAPAAPAAGAGGWETESSSVPSPAPPVPAPAPQASPQ